MSAGIEVSSLDHVHLYAEDVEVTADWYARVLGLQRMASSSNIEQGVYLATARGRYCATLFRGRPPSDGDHTTAFRVPGAVFETFGERLSELGIVGRDGALLLARDAVDHRLAYSFYFVDPAGNHLELTTYDHPRVRAWHAVQMEAET